MLIDTNKLAQKVCAKYDICYNCPLWLKAGWDTDDEMCCALTVCEKEYQKTLI